MKHFILVVFMILTVPLNSLGLYQVKEETYETYLNARYGYSVSYPKNILIPQGESDSGDGQQFLSKDKKVKMLAYASYVVEEAGNTLKNLYREESKSKTIKHPNKTVTYKIMTNNMFVVSGYENEKVFYQKTLVSTGKGCDDSLLVTFRIEYDKEQKKFFDPITAKVANSLKSPCP